MNSTNIKVISEEIQRLKDQVHAIDVEVPDPSQATDGQILSVDDGKYVISDPELPAVTSASTGDVLGLVGEAKTPGWITPYNPLDYSTTEQDTGVKWIDGKTIYSKTFVVDEDLESPSTVVKTISLLDLSIDNIIYFKGIISRIDSDGLIIYDLSDNYASTDHSQFRIVKKSNVDANYSLTFSTGKFGGGHFTLFYTKVDPIPETTLTNTKKKTTKKGE